MAKKKQKKTCDVCGGTGQVSYFKGVSRFLLSTDECEACAGTGHQFDSGRDPSGNCDAPAVNKKRPDDKS